MKTKYKTEVIRNPEELQIISNPQPLKQTISKMAKQPKKAVMDLKKRAITAGYILGGQALGATSNAFIISKFLGGQSSTIQQASKVAIPAISGLIFASTKNEHLQQLSLGLGVQSTLELIRLIVPGFAPSEGFADSSGFVVIDTDGTALPLRRGLDGNLYVTGRRRRQLPEDTQESSNAQASQVEVSDDDEVSEHQAHFLVQGNNAEYMY